MNLIGDPWIPVVFQDGQNGTVGLRGLYERAEEIRDLALAPPQRIAVMRLLICMTQAALDGPKDRDEWLACKPRIAPESLAYLDARHAKFDLFGNTPFMQIRDLRADKCAPLDKLDFGLASGNNKTLFDQSSVPEGRTHTAGWASLHLLTFLNFSTGGKVGQANWGSRKFSGSTTAAPALKAAHLFLRGGDLSKTIWRNLLAKDDVDTMPNGTWGKPIWDAFPKSPDDRACVENATQTYLGRLVPLARFVKLESERGMLSPSCIIGPASKALKFEGLPSYREPSETVVWNKAKKEHQPLCVSTEKHIWRELGAVLAVQENESDAGAGARTLKNLYQIADQDGQFDVWIGGLIPDKAAFVDAVEWNLSLPVGILGEVELKSYQTNVVLADKFAGYLSSAVRAYLDEMNAYKGNDSRSKDARKGIVKRATSIFWQELDQRYKLLLKDRPIDDDWKFIVRKALEKGYGLSCIHETPRQIQAFVAGRKRLRLHELRAKGGKNGESE